MQQIIYPHKIIDCAGVQSAENLLLHQPLQIDLIERHLSGFSTGSHIILDFGKEMRGGIRILTHRSDLSPVRVRFGESVAECCAQLGDGEAFSGMTVQHSADPKARHQNATNDHAIRDLSLELPNWSDTPLGDTGFRFVRLDFTGTCTIKSIVCINTILSHRVEYRYQGDRELEKIFKTAKRTVDLCAGSGYIWDGIKRDRLVWAGDLVPQVLSLTTLYGRTKEVEQSLEFVREQAQLPEWMNYQPVYSMWWLIMLKEYLERTGAAAFVQRQMDYAEGLIAQLAAGVDENGEMDYPGYFLDWPHAGQPQEREGARAINILAAKSGIMLLEHFGRDTQIARTLLRRLRKREIVAESKVVAALKYWAIGALSESEKKLLLTGGADGVSAFMSYYILKAVYAFSPETATAVMREYYGGMLMLGATTFWEEFEPEQLEGTPIDRLPREGQPDCHGDFGKNCYIGFRRSLCHGWSSGVIAYIKECEDIKA